MSEQVNVGAGLAGTGIAIAGFIGLATGLIQFAMWMFLLLTTLTLGYYAIRSGL